MRPQIRWMTVGPVGKARYASLAEKRSLERNETTMKKIIPLATAILLAFALMPASAASKHKRHTTAPPQQQIACTVVGCMPVPRGCHPEIGYTPWGTPTGFDVAACPNYTLYGFRR